MDNLIKHLIINMDLLGNRVDKLEENSHPKRDFIVCDKCKKEIMEVENA